MRDAFYKAFKWIWLTVAASVITVFVQGLILDQKENAVARAGSDSYFSYEKVSEEELDGLYLTQYLLILRGPNPMVEEYQVFVYPGEDCTAPEQVASELDYEWRYTSTCTTEKPIVEHSALFTITQIAR